MTENVFDQNTNKEQVAPVAPNTLTDKLKTIVDASGRPKYSDVDKALDALGASQAHIQRLEAEAATRATEMESLREQARQAEALEAVVQRLQNNSSVEKQTPSVTPMSEEATITALEKIIERKNLEKIAADNFQTVQNTLLTKFGGDVEKTKQAVAAKAAELGLTTQELGNLSSKSPKAVLAYFGETPRTVQPVIPSQTTPLTVPPQDDSLESLKPAKSVLIGATSKDQMDLMNKIKERVYRRHNIET